MNVGRHFDVGEPLCEIVDKREMMLRLTAYEKDLPHLMIGDQVEFRVSGMDLQTFHGMVAMIGQQVNSENRSIDVYMRIAEQNPQFRRACTPRPASGPLMRIGSSIGAVPDLCRRFGRERRNGRTS